MEYQKIIDFLDNTRNQASEIGQKIALKRMKVRAEPTTLMTKLNLKPSLRDYSDAYILVSGTIAVAALTVCRGNKNR